MGLSWDNQYYTDISVAFGIRHGAAFTQRVSQAVCDILGAEHIFSLPYIDDFIGGKPSLELATLAYARSLALFSELGLDLNPNKCIPPTTNITWIGVNFDSMDMTMRIPSKVIDETKTLVSAWLQKTSATRHDLQVLLGKLFHAGKCCLPARIFVGRMLSTLRDTSPTGLATLSTNFRADLQWWHQMLPTYNGRLLIQISRPTHDVYIEVDDPHVTIHTNTQTTTTLLPDRVATTDHRWANRECFAVLVALQLWGAAWREAEVLLHCTDPHKLKVLVHGRSHNDTILHIARKIWRITAEHDISLSPTTNNHPSHATNQVVVPPVMLLQ
jgi:hypothetical protein